MQYCMQMQAIGDVDLLLINKLYGKRNISIPFQHTNAPIGFTVDLYPTSCVVKNEK